MAILSFNISNTSEFNNVKNAFAAFYGYNAKLADGSDNPQTKVQFVEEQIKQYIKNITKNWLIEEAKRNIADPGDITIT